MSPNTRDGRFLVSTSKQITPAQIRAGEPFEMKLLQCNVGGCNENFKFDALISSPVFLDDGSLLFVSAKPQITIRTINPTQDVVAFRQLDFFLRTSDGLVQRLTDWKAAQLASLSVGGDRAVFQIMPGLDTPNSVARTKQQTTKIYSSQLTRNGEIKLETDIRPFIMHGKRIDTAPFISPDGTYTAFLSSHGSKPGSERGWLYEVIVIDNRSGEVVYTKTPTDDEELSIPIFVNPQTVSVMSFDGSAYSLIQIDLRTKSETVPGRFTDEDLRKAQVVIFDNS